MIDQNISKKILFATLEYPPQKGGISSYYKGLVENLEKQGFQIQVLSSSLLSKYLFPQWLLGYFKIKKLLKTEKFAWLFVGQILPLGTIAWLLRKKIKYVVFLHGMDILMAQKSFRKKFLAKKILEKAQFIVTNSNFTKNLVSDFLGKKIKKDILVIYPCPNIATEKISPEKIEELKRKLGITGKKILITVGRLVKRKGHELVLLALKEIVKQEKNIIYLIIGDGPNFQSLVKQVQKLNLNNYVRFLGEVPEEEKLHLYALADIFVMPSKQIGPDVEGFGLVFLEAGLFEKPAIGGESGGVVEAIVHGQTGFLVNPNDSQNLARIIQALLKDSDLRLKIGQNAKQYILENFNWEKEIKKIIPLLQK